MLSERDERVERTEPQWCDRADLVDKACLVLPRGLDIEWKLGDCHPERCQHSEGSLLQRTVLQGLDCRRGIRDALVPQGLDQGVGRRAFDDVHRVTKKRGDQRGVLSHLETAELAKRRGPKFWKRLLERQQEQLHVDASLHPQCGQALLPRRVVVPAVGADAVCGECDLLATDGWRRLSDAAGECLLKSQEGRREQAMHHTECRRFLRPDGLYNRGGGDAVAVE